MIIKTDVVSENLSGCTEVPLSLIYPDQLLRKLVPPHDVQRLWRVQFIGFNPVFMVFLLKIYVNVKNCKK